MRIYYRLFLACLPLASANHVTGKIELREKPKRTKIESRPEVDDQWYNLNQIKTFEDSGIDTSYFHVAYPYLVDHLGRTRAVRATLDGEFYNEWTEVDPTDGKIAIPWAVMEGYPYESEAELAMESLR